MVKFTCPQCGFKGEAFPSQLRRFCSQSCRSKWGAVHGHMPTKPRRGTEKPCEHCGKMEYRRSGSERRFCSVECHNAAQRTGRVATCPHCGTEFYKVPSQPKRFCSRICYEAQRIKSSATGRTHNGREVLRDHSGYLRIWEPDHPSANQGRVAEHRWVVEQSIGRNLLTDEHVHHVNGIKDDNRLENLRVLDAQEHRLLTAAEVKAQRKSDASELAEYRRRYGPLNLE